MTTMRALVVQCFLVVTIDGVWCVGAGGVPIEKNQPVPPQFSASKSGLIFSDAQNWAGRSALNHRANRSGD